MHMRTRFVIPLAFATMAPNAWGQEVEASAGVTKTDIEASSNAPHGPYELGLFGGMMSLSENHNLRDPDRAVVPLEDVAPELGLRVSYLPLRYLAIEGEASIMPTATIDGEGAVIGALRAHALLQYPTTHLTPFLLIGGGQLRSDSDTNGGDVDAALHYGVGVKLALTTCNEARIDLRNTVSDARDGEDTPNYPELLFGLSWSFGGTPTPPPSPPDTDRDGFADAGDPCPNVPGLDGGCPAPEPEEAAPTAAAPEPVAEEAPSATGAATGEPATPSASAATPPAGAATRPTGAATPNESPTQAASPPPEAAAAETPAAPTAQ